MKGYIMEHKYDLFIRKGVENEPNANIVFSNLEKGWWKKEKYFLGFQESLDSIQFIKEELKKINISAYIVPIAYKKTKINIEQAEEIANKEFSKVKAESPHRYGELNCISSHPIWYEFFADDYVLQGKGYIPGIWGIFINKLTGKTMDFEEVKYYQFL